MANRYTIASGLASAPSTWDGGVSVPVTGDRVLICAGHTVTLDSVVEWGDDTTSTITINAVSTTESITVRGTLTHLASVNTGITCRGSFRIYAGGRHDIGTVAAPIQLGVTATILINYSTVMADYKYGYAALAGGVYSYVGFYRKRYTIVPLAISPGATSVVVEDATGWQVGDLLHFPPTFSSSGPTQIIAIAAGYVSGSLTIPLATPVTYARTAGYPIANETCNVIIRSYSSSLFGNWVSQSTLAGNVANTREIRNTKFYDLKGAASYKAGPEFYSDDNYGSTRYANPYTALDSNVFIGPNGRTILQTASTGANITFTSPIVFTNSAFLCNGTTTGNQAYVSLNSMYAVDGALFSGTIVSAGSYESYVKNAYVVNGAVSVGLNSSTTGIFTNIRYGGLAYCSIWFSSGVVARSDFIDCDFGVAIPNSNAVGFQLQMNPMLLQMTLTDCKFAGFSMFGTGGRNNLADTSFINIVNKNKDVTQQERYFYAYTRYRENSIKNRSTSSVKISPFNLTRTAVDSISITCGNGKSIRIVGYIRRDTATTVASVTISGLGITPVVYTASAAIDTWEKYDLTATNDVVGYDGNLTLTYTVSNPSVTTSNTYFDGVPDAPFVTKCRHFGFMFDEASPTRTVNPVISITEAIAAAYTGVTITSSQITVATGTANTWAKVYAYSQAYYCLNLSSDVLLTTTDGNNFALPTTTKLSWPAMSNDGTLVGGWLLLTAGSHAYSLSGTKVDCTTAGTYAFAGTKFSGTTEFVNSSGGAVTVTLPAGTAYTNTGPNITITVAVDQAEALISSIVPGSRLQIYNVTTATEMVNIINATSSYSLSYPTGTGYSAGDIVRVRLTYCYGLDAMLPYQAITQATSAGWTVLAAQTADEIYIANNIDGSAVTEYTADYLNVQIDVSDPDAVTTLQRGYAWYCAQMLGDLGIAQYYGAMIAEDAFNYLLNTDVLDIKIQNTNLTTGVTLTGGALRRKDGSSPIAPGGSIYMYYGRTYGLETGVSGLTVEESTKLMSMDVNKLLTTAKFIALKD